ncbi:MAG: hypothetical protein U1D55_13145 [Phycisphaerae bacterium]
MFDVTYADNHGLTAAELVNFYRLIQHDTTSSVERIRQMMAYSDVFVTARIDGQLVGVARGLCDGVRGYFAECKLDPRYQGPAAVTRTDGRIEHDQYGIAAEMARRVLEKLSQAGAQRIDVLAYGTEVDFLEEQGFRRVGGLVGLTWRQGNAPASAFQREPAEATT